MKRSIVSLVCLTFAVAGCGGDDEPDESSCSIEAQTGCKTGRVCEDQVGTPACFDPIAVQGQVVNLDTNVGIAGARVVARDVNGAAVSGIATTDSAGNYKLQVPAPRDADGNPLKTDYLLRADAQGYLTFPRHPRVGLPVDVATHVNRVVQSPSTRIALIPLEPKPMGIISGKINADHPAGTLVVTNTGETATADIGGGYKIFNVPIGDAVEVRAYKMGVNFDDPLSVAVQDNKETANINFTKTGDATAVVSGSIQLVNAPGAGATTIILVAAETFDAATARGESPPGLFVGNIMDVWQIPKVPDGSYRVLAAFPNDGLVRDPDISQGGTAVQAVIVNGASVEAGSFKVTNALAVMAPGADAMEVVTTATPTFIFENDSGEASYDVFLYDALGREHWNGTASDPGGSNPITVAYPGDKPLVEGMIYQFRAISKDGSGVALSSTEDLKGIFLYQTMPPAETQP